MRSELRERLSVAEVQSQIHAGNVVRGSDVTDETIVRFVTSQSNSRKLALNIDRTLDLTDLFTVIQEIPGWAREQIGIVGDDTPLLLQADILDKHNRGVDALRLNRIEIGNNIEIQLPREGHTVAFRGTLVKKRIRFQDNLPHHRLTIWVYDERRLDDPVLVWDEGNWDEGVWG